MDRTKLDVNPDVQGMLYLKDGACQRVRYVHRQLRTRAAPLASSQQKEWKHPVRVPSTMKCPCALFPGPAPTETDADADEATAWPATAQSRASTRDCTLNPLHSHHKALAFARLIKSINGKTPDTINCNTSRYYFLLHRPKTLTPRTLHISRMYFLDPLRLASRPVSLKKGGAHQGVVERQPHDNNSD